MAFFSEPYAVANPSSDVAHGFTRDGLRALGHHANPMAFIHGAVEPFMRKHWPGLAFAEAMSLSTAAGVWTRTRTPFARRRVADHVEEFHILRDGTTRVIERRVADANPDSDESAGADGGVLLDVTSYYDATPEEQREILRQLLGRIGPR